MEELQRGGKLSEQAASLLIPNSPTYDSQWRVWVRWCDLNSISMTNFTEESLVEFAVSHHDDGYSVGYTIGIVGSVVTVYRLLRQLSRDTPLIEALRKQLKKRKSRFPAMDALEVGYDFDEAFVQPFVAKRFPQTVRGGIDFECLSVSLASIRDLLICLLRFYVPFRNSDVARIWRPSIQEGKRDGVDTVLFRTLFSKTNHMLSVPITMFCICARDLKSPDHKYCVVCVMRVYCQRTASRALCKHKYGGFGDPCKGKPCENKSFLFLSDNRSDGAYYCIKPDTIGSLSKKIMALAGMPAKFKPHFLRALAAQRLERVQGEQVSRQAGHWCQNSLVYRSSYNPKAVTIVPADFLLAQKNDEPERPDA